MIRKSFIALMICGSLLAGCGGIGGPLSLLNGGGPNVAANVQAGAENRQSAISVETAAPTPKLTFGLGSTVSGVTQTTEQNEVKADTIQNYNAGLSWWQWIIIGILIPGPVEWLLAWRFLRRRDGASSV